MNKTLQATFADKPNKVAEISRKLGVAPQAIYGTLDKHKVAKFDKGGRLTTLLFYRFCLNCRVEILDFLLDDSNFDDKQRIRRSEK